MVRISDSKMMKCKIVFVSFFVDSIAVRVYLFTDILERFHGDNAEADNKDISPKKKHSGSQFKSRNTFANYNLG